MDPDPSSSILILVLSLFASAFFSGMEMAFVASSRLQLNSTPPKAGVAGGGLLNARPQLFIASMLVGNNLALVLCGIESGPLWANGCLACRIGKAPSTVACLGHQTLVTTSVVLVLAEFIPKSLFHASPNAWLGTWRTHFSDFHRACLAGLAHHQAQPRPAQPFVRGKESPKLKPSGPRIWTTSWKR